MMVDPIEELIKRSNEFHLRLIKENNELDRAFHQGALGEFVHSRSSNDDAGTAAENMAGEDSETLLLDQSRGESGESATSESTI